MGNRGLETYKKIERITNSPRETEARVLTRGALMLKECLDKWEAEERKKLLGAALRFNQKIWSIFQANLAAIDSPLPHELRFNLLKLSAFVDRQIFAVMALPSPDKIESIIKVNLSIATGLRAKQEVASVEEPTEARSSRLEITR
ncbi:MAG: flagellar biosynthesis regulator FlaF [Syntrophales bacterium]